MSSKNKTSIQHFAFKLRKGLQLRMKTIRNFVIVFSIEKKLYTIQIQQEFPRLAVLAILLLHLAKVIGLLEKLNKGRSMEKYDLSCLLVKRLPFSN